jgi:selenium metabolism protein YedF
MTRKIVDAKGLLCPRPLIMTKQALTALGIGEEMIVIIDNDASRANVERFLRDNDTEIRTEEKNGDFVLTVRKKEAALAHPEAESYCRPAETARPHVVCVKADTMGSGDQELGLILIKAFINTIKEVQPLPDTIVFYNSGIFLTLKDSPVLEPLQDLEKKGIRILVCGTCIEYYGKKAEVGVGIVSNMYELLETLTEAGHIVTP